MNCGAERIKCELYPCTLTVPALEPAYGHRTINVRLMATDPSTNEYPTIKANVQAAGQVSSPTREQH